MPLESLETKEVALADAQWQARVDLAAAHRICVMEGFHEGIFNHLTLRVPGHDDRYYQIPFGLHWSEVTASCLMEVGYDGTLLAGEGEIEAFGILHPRAAASACCRTARRCSTRTSPTPLPWPGWRIRGSCRSARPSSAS